ncbi:hypothetical protein TWF696_008404 [Orbilia brochopaga]|uniref:Uncharacterized protein n=1 Tax=Orbilia brochopaga TaxID=3140254 RepID=A0AAV9UKA7_9PEZI
MAGKPLTGKPLTGKPLTGKPLTSGTSCQHPAGHDGIVTVIDLSIQSRQGKARCLPPNLPSVHSGLQPFHQVGRWPTAGKPAGCFDQVASETDRQTNRQTAVKVREAEESTLLVHSSVQRVKRPSESGEVGFRAPER